ncbi:Condensin complex subunit 1 [Chionoecetes opilio]|uniref:Condensin complex subunit 1 n=1 Tax=Chionoecetes opilio TaxID=41210 RepID=A0A8J4YD47_CHIOP|nr:Condensin complex subunit 1 [Chionoecetes opilio]
MGELVSKLGRITNGDVTGPLKLKWLNIVKMTTFIACKLTEAMENKYNKTSADVVVTGRGKKKAVKDAGSSYSWPEDRNNMLLHLYSLVQHPLQRLWEPPVMEDDFVILIGDCCYKILECPSMALVKTKNTRASIFQILGTLIKKFNHECIRYVTDPTDCAQH